MILGRLLDPWIGTAEVWGDVVAPVYPDEADGMRRASTGRVREFSTGRYCARTALTAIGARAAALPREPSGSPRWPRGVVGSITHCAGYRGAVAAWRADCRCIGIDAEPDLPLPEDVADYVMSSGERQQARSAPDENKYARANYDRLLFCMKEATYKCYAGLNIVPDFDFTDIRVQLDGERGGMSSLAPDGARFVGRWGRDNGIIVAVAVGDYDRQKRPDHV